MTKENDLNEVFQESWLERFAGLILVVVLLGLMIGGAFWISHISKIIKEGQLYPPTERPEK